MSEVYKFKSVLNQSLSSQLLDGASYTPTAGSIYTFRRYDMGGVWYRV